MTGNRGSGPYILKRNPSTGEFEAAGKGDSWTSHTSPGYLAPELPLPAPLDETVDEAFKEKFLAEIGAIHDFRTKLKSLEPESVMKFLSIRNHEFFQDDLSAVLAQEDIHPLSPAAEQYHFVHVKYHIGERGSPFEFYSPPFPLEINSWDVITKQLIDHLRDTVDGDVQNIDDVRQIPFRIVFFHKPNLHVKLREGDREKKGFNPNLCYHPIDFGMSLGLTVGEFEDYFFYRKTPEALRLGFDSGYFALGENTHDAFQYTTHWELF
ncbi:hypothetical protein ACFL0V_05930, partial [Nanoarchaeota archaeon]